jgi:hypothetical protein
MREAWEVPFRNQLKKRSKKELDRRGLLALLSNRPKSAYPPDYVDLWFLYRLVRKRKPRCVLEFGAGCSTVILAQALSDNARQSSEPVGHLYSVDAVPFWAETTRELMPNHLKDLSTVTASEIVAVDCNGHRVLRHAQAPDVSPEFIYLDGPDFQDFRDKTTFAAVCDPLDYEPRIKPGFCMVIDGRVENTKFLRENLKRRYAVKRRWPLERWRTAVFELLA